MACHISNISSENKHNAMACEIFNEARLKDVEKLISDASGNTALMLAIQNNIPSAARTLVEARADVNVTRYEDRHLTPVLVAAENGNIDCLMILINGGANVNDCRNDGETPLTLAVGGRYLHCVEILINAGADVNYVSSAGSPLMIAVKNKDVDCLRVLIDNGAKINLPGNDGYTPLSLAVQQKNPDLAKVLISKGADPSYMSPAGTPVMVAVKNIDQECLHTLLDGKESGEHNSFTNIQDRDGKTALIFAAETRNISACYLLLQHSAGLNIQDNNGKTALVYSVQNNDRDLCQVLIDNFADVNIKDKDGRTALMYAVVNECFELILSNGADILLSDNQHRSAVVYLLENRENQNVAPYTIDHRLHIILKRGANPELDPSHRLLLSIWPPPPKDFYCSGETLKKWTIEKVIKQEQLIRMFVCNGIVPDIKDSRYRSPFHCALQLACNDAVRYLIANCYLTYEDVNKLGENAAQPNEFLIYVRSCIPDCNRYMKNKIKVKKLLRLAVRQPWPLVKLAFIAVSSALGVSPDREQRIKQTQLPHRLQRMLMFQEPVSRLPVSEWSNIPLCFDPVEYEKLPKPRPLLYYWPFGRDLVV